MPATVTIRRRTGTTGAPTNTDVTATSNVLSVSDSPTPGSANPCQIPNAGTNYSFWASFYLNADTTPAGTIDTVKGYFDGADSYGAGITLKMTTVGTYVEAVGSATTGTQLLIGNYAGITPSPPNDAFGYTSASPLAITGSISNPSTGKISDFVVLQMEGASTTTPGATIFETMTWTYNET